MAKRHNYKNLKIWSVGLEIAFRLSELIEDFPKHERFALASQMGRCSTSIASNIAEGSARSDKSFRVFLDYSLGSSFELSTQLLLAVHKKYIIKKELEEIESQIEEWQMMTMGFQNRL